MTRVLTVIGGGITGLSCGYEALSAARKAGIDLTVRILEAGPHPGGVIRSLRGEDAMMEQGPDCFISTKPAGVEMVKTLGLEDQLISTSKTFRRSFIVKGDRLHPVPEGLYLMAPTRIVPFALSPLISIPGKLRMALEWFVPRNRSDEDESLESFVKRRLGQEALDYIAQPMIGGIYTADPAHLSLKATFPQFLELEQKHGSILRGFFWGRRTRETGSVAASKASGPRYGLFLSFKNGMQTLVDALARELPADSLVTGARATRIERLPGGTGPRWSVSGEGFDPIESDAICVCLTANLAGRLLPDDMGDLAGELDQIPYNPAMTVNLLYQKEDIRHNLEGMGFVVPRIEGRRVVGCSFSSTKFEGRAVEGKVLLRAFIGGRDARASIEADEDEVVNGVIRDLDDLLGFKADPVKAVLSRWPTGLPHYPPGHLDRVDRIETQERTHPGFALAGNAYRGVGIPDCIASARRAVDRLVGEMTSN